MSHIVVQGDHLNQLVYKYLLEQGYTHAAFALEAEAHVDAEAVLAKRIPPRLLVQLCEQALLLRYMETHPDSDQTRICTAPLTLLDPHTCAVVERGLLGKRELIRQTNQEIAKEISDSLVRIDREAALATGPMQMADQPRMRASGAKPSAIRQEAAPQQRRLD